MSIVPTEEFKKLGELIKDIKVAMLTTVESDGTLHARPLAALHYSCDETLWFFVQIDSAKVSEIDHDTRASVTFSNPSTNSYVAIAGTAEILRDAAKAKELWTPFARAWFPAGLDDPELALLKVRMERAEYWTSAGKAMYLFGVAKAALTGRRPNVGEDHKLTM